MALLVKIWGGACYLFQTSIDWGLRLFWREGHGGSCV